MKVSRLVLASVLTITTASALLAMSGLSEAVPPIQMASFESALKTAFDAEGFRLSTAQVSKISDNARLGVMEACKSPGNSEVGFTAAEIAHDLNLNPAIDSQVVHRISEVLDTVANQRVYCDDTVRPMPQPWRPHPPRVDMAWRDYFRKTVNLNNDSKFISLLQGRDYSPVHISWEDIGRYENSVWGDRISDVGIWVRKNESDLNTAELALSVRRDDNFSDKVLVVPSDKIKVHQKVGNKTIEKTLPQRLKELGLASSMRDKNVIVSNQFAIVPVPAYYMKEAAGKSHPPRVAFNFSIYPYGSTNYVITDVIEGSSEALVGPGQHQLIYYNNNGKKAPFTASRASDRADLMKLEAELKAQGMDVDVQRYYLIQVPIKKNVMGLTLSNMGTPPGQRFQDYFAPESDMMVGGSYNGGGGSGGPMPYPAAAPKMAAPGIVTGNAMKSSVSDTVSEKLQEERARADEGLVKVAIGHGESEGKYIGGSGFAGQRADEPIRVTVVYFVTPVGEVSEADMQRFANAFEGWDSQAIWGGSFVTKTASN